MHLSNRAQTVTTCFLDHRASSRFDCCRNALWKHDPQRSTAALHPADKFFPGQDGGCSHRDIGFCLGLLINLDFSRLFQEGPLDHSFVGEFIGKRSFTVRSLQQQILDYPSMAPGQQIIQVTEFLVEQVVFFRSDKNDVRCQTGITPAVMRAFEPAPSFR